MKGAVKALVDSRILGRALVTGVALEAAFVAVGHYHTLLDTDFGLFACMMIAGTAALLYARDLARGYGAGALGGVAIGAMCGIVAVASASLLGDRPDLFIPYGVMVSTLTGGIGGLFGQMDASFKAFLKTLSGGNSG